MVIFVFRPSLGAKGGKPLRVASFLLLRAAAQGAARTLPVEPKREEGGLLCNGRVLETPPVWTDWFQPPLATSVVLPGFRLVAPGPHYAR